MFLLRNSDFTEGMTAWDTHVQGIYDGESRASFSVDSNALKATIEHEGANPWDIQLIQGGLDVNEGLTYIVSFVARTDVPREMEVVVQNSAYHRFLSEIVPITTETQLYNFEFTMNSNELVELSYLMGKLQDSALIGSEHHIYIDNVRLEVKGAFEALGIRLPTVSDIDRP